MKSPEGRGLPSGLLMMVWISIIWSLAAQTKSGRPAMRPVDQTIRALKIRMAKGSKAKSMVPVVLVWLVPMAFMVPAAWPLKPI